MLRNASGNPIDEAIEGLRGHVVPSSSSRFSLDDDVGGRFRGVELDEFQFQEEGESHVTVRPKRNRRCKY